MVGVDGGSGWRLGSESGGWRAGQSRPATALGGRAEEDAPPSGHTTWAAPSPGVKAAWVWAWA